jgi:prepilin-type processing-associated H-X9-DG protein
VVTLAEDLYLLASDGTSGRLLIEPSHLDLGLGGALLLDLGLKGHVAFVDGHVTAIDNAPTGEPLLDAALAEIAGQPRPHEPDHWIRHLGRGAHRAVQHRLVDVGILRRDDDRILHVIPVHHTHETDARLHHELVDHLREAVVLGRAPSSETAALAALALAVGLDRHLFPRADRLAVRKRMTEISDECVETSQLARAVACEVNAVDAALGIPPAYTTLL